MKKNSSQWTILLMLIGFLFLFPFFNAQARSPWQAVGASKGYVSAGAAYETDVTVSDTGQIYAAFEDRKSSKKVRVKKLIGSNWINLADSNYPDGLISRSSSLKPSLAAKGDELYVAYTESQDNWRIRVKKWDGAAWSDLADGNYPSGLISSAAGTEPEIIFDKSQSHLYVAFEDAASGGKIKVMQWDGSAWQAASDLLFTDGVISYNPGAEVALAASQIDDSIYVAYQDAWTNSRLRIKKFDGHSWTEFIASDYTGLITRSPAYSPSITVDSQDHLYVVYTFPKQGNTRLLYWNGSNWDTTLGNGIVSKGKTIESQIIVDSTGRITAAFSKLKKTGKKKKTWGIMTTRWDGSKWVDQGYLSSKGKGDPSMATANGQVYLIFTDYSSRKRARMLVY